MNKSGVRRESVFLGFFFSLLVFIFDVAVTSCTITPCKPEKMRQSADVMANVKKKTDNPKTNPDCLSERR